MITVGRDQWLGYRWQQHFHRAADDLLLLGVQDAWAGGAEQALAQRQPAKSGALVRMWSVRGAPHAHPVTHLDFVRDALRPQPDEDGGEEYVAAVDEVATALTAVVTAPMTKGEASTAVTQRVPAELVSHCARCRADHVPDGLFRAGGRQAGLVLGEATRGTVLEPRPAHRQTRVRAPREALLAAFRRVNGPAARATFTDFVQSSTAAVQRIWEAEDLVRVTVGGKRAELPEALLDPVRTTGPAAGVVLVPPGDPYLRQVDRTLLVPDAKRRAQIWRPVSPPGALLVDGEVAGVWRYRPAKHDVTITAFGRLAAARKREAEQSAAALDAEAAIAWED